MRQLRRVAADRRPGVTGGLIGQIVGGFELHLALLWHSCDPPGPGQSIMRMSKTGVGHRLGRGGKSDRLKSGSKPLELILRFRLRRHA